ncbi:MAG TPA: BlaI/MecI/CopY family transcriptional regulator [Vicinamibacterales bacterium]|jgi:predicted transcriptional regulator
MLFRRRGAGLEGAFGTLELRVLEALWRRGEASVRELRDEFPSAAYTTLMTTMDRLHRKGALERRKDGRAFVYRPAHSREELESGLVARAIAPLLRPGQTQPILSCFLDELSRHDESLLDDLERLVREKRRRQDAGE